MFDPRGWTWSILGFALGTLVGVLACTCIDVATYTPVGPDRSEGYRYGAVSYEDCEWAIQRGFTYMWNTDEWRAGCRLRVDDGHKVMP